MTYRVVDVLVAAAKGDGDEEGGVDWEVTLLTYAAAAVGFTGSAEPLGSGRVTIQSCLSKGGSVLNQDGNILPAQRCKRALGDRSPGLPSNRANWACSPLSHQLISQS